MEEQRYILCSFLTLALHGIGEHIDNPAVVPTGKYPSSQDLGRRVS